METQTEPPAVEQPGVETWTDRKGGVWDISFTIGTINDVKKATGVNLDMSMSSQEAIGKVLFADFGRKFAEVLYVISEEQAKAREIEPDAWAHLFDGPTLERATVAFLNGLAGLFPRSKVGAALKENFAASLADMDNSIIKKIVSKK